MTRAPRIGIGGPVGSGKTMLCLKLCQSLRQRYSMAVVTNDIYCSEDAQYLIRQSALPGDRIVGADLDVMARDARAQRTGRPFLFCDLKREYNLPAVIAWLEREVLFGRNQVSA